MTYISLIREPYFLSSLIFLKFYIFIFFAFAAQLNNTDKYAYYFNLLNLRYHSINSIIIIINIIALTQEISPLESPPPQPWIAISPTSHLSMIAHLFFALSHSFSLLHPFIPFILVAVFETNLWGELCSEQNKVQVRHRILRNKFRTLQRALRQTAWKRNHLESRVQVPARW